MASRAAYKKEEDEQILNTGFDHLDFCLVGLVCHHLVEGGDYILADDALVSSCLELLFNRSNLLCTRTNIQSEAERIWTETSCDEI